MPISNQPPVAHTMLDLAQSNQQRTDNLRQAQMQGEQNQRQMQLGLLQTHMQDNLQRDQMALQDRQFRDQLHQRGEQHADELQQADEHFKAQQEQLRDQFEQEMDLAETEAARADTQRKFERNLMALESEREAAIQNLTMGLELEGMQQQQQSMQGLQNIVGGMYGQQPQGQTQPGYGGMTDTALQQVDQANRGLLDFTGEVTGTEASPPMFSQPGAGVGQIGGARQQQTQQPGGAAAGSPQGAPATQSEQRLLPTDHGQHTQAEPGFDSRPSDPSKAAPGGLQRVGNWFEDLGRTLAQPVDFMSDTLARLEEGTDENLFTEQQQEFLGNLQIDSSRAAQVERLTQEGRHEEVDTRDWMEKTRADLESGGLGFLDNLYARATRGSERVEEYKHRQRQQTHEKIDQRKNYFIDKFMSEGHNREEAVNKALERTVPTEYREEARIAENTETLMNLVNQMTQVGMAQGIDIHSMLDASGARHRFYQDVEDMYNKVRSGDVKIQEFGDQQVIEAELRRLHQLFGGETEIEEAGEIRGRGVGR